MREITILVNDRDFEDMLRYFSRADRNPDRQFGRPLVAVHGVVAVDGDQGFDLHQFEKADTEAR